MRSAAGTPTMLMHLMQTVSAAYSPVWKSKFYGAFVLNHRVVLHAIDATLLDGVAMPVPRSSTGPARAHHRREMT